MLSPPPPASGSRFSPPCDRPTDRTMPSELNSAISKKEKKEKKAKSKLPKVESFQSVIDIFDGGLAPSPANKDLASIAESSSEAAKAFLAQHEITIHDPSAPPPCMSFDSARDVSTTC